MKSLLVSFLGIAVTAGSLAVAICLPISAPVLFDALSGLGVVAGLLILASFEYAPKAPKPAAPARRDAAVRTAASVARRARRQHAAHTLAVSS